MQEIGCIYSIRWVYRGFSKIKMGIYIYGSKLSNIYTYIIITNMLWYCFYTKETEEGHDCSIHIVLLYIVSKRVFI